MNNAVNKSIIRTWVKPVVMMFDWLLDVLVLVVEDDNPGITWESQEKDGLVEGILGPGPVKIEPGNLENL